MTARDNVKALQPQCSKAESETKFTRYGGSNMPETDFADGWVMVRRDTGTIIDFTWRRLRREAIHSLCRLSPRRSRQSILREWMPVKASRTITVN